MGQRGYLLLTGRRGTYLGLGGRGTYLGRGVPTLDRWRGTYLGLMGAGGVSIFDRGRQEKSNQISIDPT